MRILMLARTALIALALWTMGCASVVPAARPDRPTAIYLTDYGVHSSLLLPNGDGRYVEYCFGDWDYSALNRCWPNNAVAALFLSPHSAFGRRYVDAPPFGELPKPMHPSPGRIQVIYASQENVDKVLNTLEARWDAGSKNIVHNPDNDTDYVPDTEHYSLANNCNHLTARCLREMGCDVHGLVVISKFRVTKVPNVGNDDASIASSHKTGIISSAQAN